MSDPVTRAAIEIGLDSDWELDIVQADDRLLIVDADTNLVHGEILSGTGTVVALDEPYPYEEEV